MGRIASSAGHSCENYNRSTTLLDCDSIRTARGTSPSSVGPAVADQRRSNDSVPRRAVVLFARPPALECAAKGLAGATRVFDLTLRRLRAASARAGAELVVVGDGWAAAPDGVRYLPQRGRGFGERLGHAFGDVRALGFTHVVSVGIDSPGLGVRHLDAAFAALSHASLVLGPADDGGVYLIGCSGALEARLGEIRWFRPTVRAQLCAISPGVVVLPYRLADVDGYRDLVRAAGDDPEVAALLTVNPPSGERPRRVFARRSPRPCAGMSRRGPPAALPA